MSPFSMTIFAVFELSPQKRAHPFPLDFCIALRYILIMPSEMRFARVKKMLEAKGYKLDRISSSHHVFIKPGASRPMVIPVHHGKVKPRYVEKIQKL